jgi:hypothetical protein
VSITESNNRQELTSVDEMLRNLAEVLRIRDARTSYLASATMERLTLLASASAQRLRQLKSTAATQGFVHLNLLNRPWLGDPDLALLYRSFMETFQELVAALRSYRPIWSLDPRVTAAASKIQEAYKSLTPAGNS